MGRAANAAMKRPVIDWPSNPRELVRGVNDSWNSYQRAHKGRTVTTAEWKAERETLWQEYDKCMALSPTSTDDGYFEQRAAVAHELGSPVGAKRTIHEAAVAPASDFYEDHSNRSVSSDSTLDEYHDLLDDDDHFCKRVKGDDWDDGDYISDDGCDHLVHPQGGSWITVDMY